MRCEAKNKIGRACKNNAMKGSKYCYVHSFGKFRGVPWYKNLTVHSLAFTVIGVVLAVYFGFTGATKAKQEEIKKAVDNVPRKTVELLSENKLDQKNREIIKNKLKKLYGELSVLSDYPIPSGDLKVLQAYESRVNKWVSDTSMWIEINIGFGARERFLNRGEGGRVWSPNYDERFNKLLSDLKRYKLGLEELIKSDGMWFENKNEKRKN